MGINRKTLVNTGFALEAEGTFPMHASSLENMKKALDYYVGSEFFAVKQRRVADIGSCSVNGSYRQLFSGLDVEYVGLDLAQGEGVDVILESPYSYTLPDGSADLVISGQMLEHCEYFWLAFQEMVRILSPDGYMILIAPSAGPIHQYPVDCYRFYPDSFRALAKLTNCHVAALWRDERGPWHDLVGIFVKNRDVSNGKSITPLSSPSLETGEKASRKDEKLKYEYEIDPTSDSAGAHVIRLVGNNKRVLELGPGPGAVTRHLRLDGCSITALEFDEASIEKARPYCERIYRGDLNNASWPDLLGGEGLFDAVVAADVLEHLYDPLATLVSMAKFMKSDGCIILSLPHIGHSAIHACLLDEDFEYKKSGLLDKTHIRFFGIRNMQALIEQAGLKIIQAEFSVRTPEQTELANHWEKTSSATRSELARNPFGLVYQVIIKAVPQTAAGDPISLMTLPVIRGDLVAYGKNCRPENRDEHMSRLIAADRAAIAENPTEALSLYRSALPGSHDPAFVWLRIIKLLQSTGQQDALLQACIDAEPAKKMNLELLLISLRVKHKAGLIDETLAEAECATQLNPQLLPIWALKGNCLCAAKRWKEAIPNFRQALQLSTGPGHFWTYAGLGDSLIREGHREEGESVFRQAFELALVEKRPDVSYRWGQALLAQGALTEALSHLEGAAAGSVNPAFHVALAKLLHRLGRSIEAAQHLREAIKRGIDSPPLRALLQSIQHIPDQTGRTS